jgi:hypothetical protein
MRKIVLLGALGALVLACSETNDPAPADGAAGAAGEVSSESGGSAGESPVLAGAGAAGEPRNDAGAGGASTVEGGEGGVEASAGNPGGAGAAPAFECTGEGARFVTDVVDFAFGEGQDHGQDEFPQPILGAPLGGGCCMGSLDVTSLGEGGFVVVEFENNVITDGEGPDFIVFENPFVPQGADESTVFAEIGSVAVSQDGDEWFDFPCTADEYPFGDCAGWRAVLANADDNELSPFDPEAAGGDAFDLSDVGLEWARYVRVEDREDVEGTFDLDAVAIVNAGCE